ncbi:hypothetical protein CYMTET_10822 [Cymbomonas tetramitiformis]|uniref:Uncharacterized protein n=1 Tax=Cymbomonas tetramitiformis TaxID=36881 RepID=A0AAE0LDG2_9CHLO|nr:hypothetical protein CYMTET_10822 [Cymbomonas tetramitiformis]
MREYNLKHLFPKHKMGITMEEWLKLPEAKQQQVAASAEVKDRLAAELSSMQAAEQAGGGKGEEAQARSDDGDDEAEYDSNFNEREEYAADERADPAGEEVVTSNHSEGGSTPGLQARAAIALGNTQKMQGFPVKTPEEFDKDAQIAAMLLAQRAINLPKDTDNLLALEEIQGKEPTEPVRHPTETRAYDALRIKMKDHLTEDQTLQMAHVQPICKVVNATLYEGLALVSSGRELMLCRVILMDTGANCNIIAIAVGHARSILMKYTRLHYASCRQSLVYSQTYTNSDDKPSCGDVP